MERDYLPNKKVDVILGTGGASCVGSSIAVVGLTDGHPRVSPLSLEDFESLTCFPGVQASQDPNKVYWDVLFVIFFVGLAIYRAATRQPTPPTSTQVDAVYDAIPPLPVDTTAAVFLSLVLVLLAGYITGRTRWALVAPSTVMMAERVTQVVRTTPGSSQTVFSVEPPSVQTLPQSLHTLGQTVTQLNGATPALWVAATAGVAVTLGLTLDDFRTGEWGRRSPLQRISRVGHHVVGSLGISILIGGLAWLTLVWMGHTPSPLRILQEIQNVGRATTGTIENNRFLVEFLDLGARTIRYLSMDPTHMVVPFFAVPPRVRRWVGGLLLVVVTFLVVDHFFLAPNSLTYPLADSVSRPRVVLALLKDQVEYLTREYEILQNRPAYKEDPEVREWVDNNYCSLINLSKLAAAGLSEVTNALEDTHGRLDQPKLYVIQGRPSVATRMARFVAELIWR